MIDQFLWSIIAWVATRPAITDWLIDRAKRTPYTHITSMDGQDIYMGRWWLFNAYQRGADGEQAPARWSWLPSIRIHHIMREDRDRHLHDHPWNARTIVLRGWYEEERKVDANTGVQHDFVVVHDELREVFMRRKGYTGRLLFGQYHRISTVAPSGAWTLFITWRKRGTWGFDVNGEKVPWRQYLGLE